MKIKCDFSGWATRNNLKCSDGRTIRENAFAGNDGMTVPLVWMHRHNEPENVIGHALLENRRDGVYAYGFLNDTENGKTARELVKNGDVKMLSIWANGLKQRGGDVLHGVIREVSLVLSGANPGAYIESVMIHSDDADDGEATIYTGYDVSIGEASTEEPEIKHSEEKTEDSQEGEDVSMKNDDMEMMHADDAKGEPTVKDVVDSMTDIQRKVMYALIGMAVEEAKKDKGDEDEDMKHNVFDTEDFADTLSHGMTEEEEKTIIADAKKHGSLKESFLAHADEYGIENIDWLFPDAKNLNVPPEFVKRDTSWVSKFMNASHHTPFSRVKSMFANITADEARARGYIKGNYKKEEVFTLLKRTTDPQTVYKKQKLHRDDVLDITDFDVVAWLKGEMRGMLDEEIARAALIGDGRSPADEDKISEDHIRPIATDEDFYAIKKAVVANPSDVAASMKNFITSAIRARKDYKGSGTPTLWTTEETLTEMLLLTDEIGHDLYESEAKLATKLRVKEIQTVEVMENATITISGTEHPLLGIIVNPVDYNFGADKGGAVNMFDDFDIDYNQQKYLIETRCSGALIKPYSAIVLYGTTE